MNRTKNNIERADNVMEHISIFCRQMKCTIWNCEIILCTSTYFYDTFIFGRVDQNNLVPVKKTAPSMDSCKEFKLSQTLGGNEGQQIPSTFSDR